MFRYRYYQILDRFHRIFKIYKLVDSIRLFENEAKLRSEEFSHYACD